jgi:outer membrane scaffolding protein for murein synthesis (MipA/OmpV family)
MRNRAAIAPTMWVVLAATLLFGADSRLAFAEDPHWLVAAGVAHRPDYEGSEDSEAFPVGSARVWWDDGRYAELVGARSSGSAPRLMGNLLPNSYLELGPVVQYRLERDDVSQNSVDALPDIDGALELGAFAAYWFNDEVKLTTLGVVDASGEHDGGLIELSLDYSVALGQTLQFGAGLASTWASDDYMDTYFGVTAAGSAASGLPVYSADAGFKDVGLRLSSTWHAPGWDHLRISGLLSGFRMLGDADDSPLVDIAGKQNQLFAALLFGWEY